MVTDLLTQLRSYASLVVILIVHGLAHSHYRSSCWLSHPWKAYFLTNNLTLLTSVLTRGS